MERYYPHSKKNFKGLIYEGKGETFLYIDINRLPIWTSERIMKEIKSGKSSENLDRLVLELVREGYASPVYALRGC